MRRYDLMVCRNVVIYFDRLTQERLFAGVHDALVPGGILILGKVETLVGPGARPAGAGGCPRAHLSEAGVSAREIVVRVADMAVATADEVLVTVGLGSCVAIMLYDPEAKVGGLAHILLPSKALAAAVRQPGEVPPDGGARAAGADGGGWARARGGSRRGWPAGRACSRSWRRRARSRWASATSWPRARR